MAFYLRLTIRFLQPYAHGRSDGGEPEWPPSPLRLYQALVAASAAHWNERMQLDYAVPALRWLADRSQPDLVACRGIASEVPTQFYVPDNTADTLVPAYKRGEANLVPKRTEKVVRPTHLNGEAVHFLYPLPAEGCPHEEVLKAAARSITHLGWGIDMVAGDAAVISEAEAAALPGERWQAAQSGGVPLRVPTPGTLDDLIRKHADFLNRLSSDVFKPVPPLRYYDVKQYRRANDPEPRPWCAFSILDPEASKNRAFSTPRRAGHVAAWIRHAVGIVCKDWPDAASFVHGHDPSDSKKQAKGDSADLRFQFLPLPTIEHRGEELGTKVTTIRRVLIAAPPGFQDRIDFIRRRLLGQELAYDGTTHGLLNLLPGKDWVRDQYTKPARKWSTVIPAVLPGYDDHDRTKTHKLICKALRESGLPLAALEGCEFEWGPFGYRSGVEPVRDFKRPDHLTGSMVHLRVKFCHPVRGPLAIGAGRYRGFGLFAAEE